MSESIKVLPPLFIGEGYVEQEKNNLKNDPWVGIYAAYQNRLILQHEVTAIENINIGEESIPCLVLKFGQDIKGLIPVHESGIRGTEREIASKQKEEGIKANEDEVIDNTKNDNSEVVSAKKKRRKAKTQDIQPDEIVETVIEIPAPETVQKANPIEKISIPRWQIIVRMRQLIGQQIVFKVKKIDMDNNLCILSRKEALDQLQGVTWQEIKEGDIRKAVVRYVTQSVVYMSVGGIEAKMPASDISYGYISDAREVIKPGEVMGVKVIGIDRENNKISVSAKALKDRDAIWKSVLDRYIVKGEYLGTLTGIIETGMFVNLERDIDVFIAHPRNRKLGLKLKIGQKIIVRITGLNLDKKRLFGRLSRIVG